MDTEQKQKKPSPKKRHAFFSASLFLAGFLVALVCCGFLMLQFLADRWWPATLLLFGPRWLFLLPFLVMLPVAALFQKRKILLPLVLAGITIGLLAMDLRLAPAGLQKTNPAAPGVIRIMTYNIGGMRRTKTLMRTLAAVRPDIALLQERNGVMVTISQLAAQGWHLHHYHGLDLISRFPIRRIDAKLPLYLASHEGSGKVVRYDIATPSGPFTLINLQLATAQEGLRAVFDKGIKGIPELKHNSRLRWRESRYAVSRIGGGSFPVLVAGDFNIPVESEIFRQVWEPRFTDAFSEAGFGLGATRLLGWYGVRIDHILADRNWDIVKAWVGKNQGLDHSPLIAEVRLTRKP